MFMVSNISAARIGSAADGIRTVVTSDKPVSISWIIEYASDSVGQPTSLE